MKQYKGYLVDLDGTMYRGSEPIPHAATSIHSLVEQGSLVRYLTNNSAANPEAVTQKLKNMGAPCEPDWVINSAHATLEFCLQQCIHRVFVVGEPYLHQFFREEGMRFYLSEPDAVIVGICRDFDYEILAEASTLIREGAAFIATNTDKTFPGADGQTFPGAGSLVSAISTASGKEPYVMGKPEPKMIELALNQMKLTPQDVLMIGDRYETDIEAGQRAGCDTFQVLTGVTKTLPEGQMGGKDLTEL